MALSSFATRSRRRGCASLSNDGKIRLAAVGTSQGRRHSQQHPFPTVGTGPGRLWGRPWGQASQQTVGKTVGTGLTTMRTAARRAPACGGVQRRAVRREDGHLHRHGDGRHAGRPEPHGDGVHLRRRADVPDRAGRHVVAVRRREPEVAGAPEPVRGHRRKDSLRRAHDAEEPNVGTGPGACWLRRVAQVGAGKTVGKTVGRQIKATICRGPIPMRWKRWKYGGFVQIA